MELDRSQPSVNQNIVNKQDCIIAQIKYGITSPLPTIRWNDYAIMNCAYTS